MKALVFDPNAPRGLRLADVPAPSPSPSQALIQVRAIALNFGELAFIANMRQPGDVLGWDAAGIVIRAAADGSGPQEGAQVSTFGWGGGWAELRAVETNEIGVAPDEIDFGAASALPVAGVAALRALRKLGPTIGRRVLVTGASGGVGRFAVQLAHRAGARVIAYVGSAARGEGLREIGADEVVADLDEVTMAVDGVIETIGGAVLGKAFSLVAPGGSLQSVGMASLAPSTIDFEVERFRPDKRIEVFNAGARFGTDLTFLLQLLAKKALDPQIGWRGSWERAREAADALLARQVKGKAVLDLPSRSSLAGLS